MESIKKKNWTEILEIKSSIRKKKYRKAIPAD
jgi:hypothetical protein